MENKNTDDFQLKRDHDGQNHSHELNFAQSKVRVRCPQCFKLFSISGTHISEPRPRFGCTSCDTQFWIPFPEALEQEELLGFPVSWLDNKAENISSHLKQSEIAAPLNASDAQIDCPKCGKKNDLQQKECKSCGVIFSQYKDQQEDLEAGYKTSRQLREAWKTLIDDFDKPELHEGFIQLCQKESSLDYAIYRYGRVNKACPTDEISSAMLERLEKLSMTSFPMAADEAKKTEKAKRVKPQTPFSTQVSNFVIGLGIVLMAMGYFLPTFRNIVGVGAATVFLAIAIRIYFRKS